MEFDINPLTILKDQLNSALTSFIESAPQLIAALAFLFFTWLIKVIVVKVFIKATTRSGLRPSLQEALRKIIVIGIWGIGILIAAMIAMPGLTPTKLLAGLGIGSIAIGLAFKDTFENLLAGLLLLMREPMRIDDYIECEDVEGQIKHISIRDTYIRRTDGVLTIVPNGYLYSNPLRILTDQTSRRITIQCGVGYGEDVDESREVIRAAVEGVGAVNKDKPVQVFAQGFGASSIDFEVTWWTQSKPVDIRESRDQVVAAIKRALDEAGIEIPFPQRTLTFSGPVPFAGKDQTDS
ncbi:mechanosensitive ion channel family protein [Pseudomonas neustonica]|uniref:Small-conductance mechanosensitive channel n=1 Tax=Pseudomonas neustonica TaxID=2487346 RepID=A0ABX9XHC1_9PSED|nr:MULTISPECIES: mechanosensitive ion channel [Pseudomonas]MAB25049.1 mechanosensitive ion channel protein MscS [Pseudomonadales bacterium]MBA6420051.1 mechanosensitive ion channel [Pseudomonas sp. 5Ae-yellow]ROZ82225.1 mechanosensitive ion channel family protein [Pseudomonas sp. SSM44]ROZ84043.1 mechanosensitive ion channel family protein [Pseudomonas neustonica]|tara:strand:+ start:1061 stop:1942 length:882 start_codon:yes stop_codon:yes gene_type:complete